MVFTRRSCQLSAISRQPEESPALGGKESLQPSAPEGLGFLATGASPWCQGSDMSGAPEGRRNVALRTSVAPLGLSFCVHPFPRADARG